jgi:cobalt-zinc-cadmium efflux system outer membrane protein
MRLRSQLRPLVVALACAGALSGADAPVAQAEFLRVVAEAPALSAAARRATAARERIDSAGRLGDPQVEAMAARMNAPMGERRTIYELNVRQPLPKRGERAADRDRARASAAMANADFAAMVGEMAADTAMAIAEVEGAQQRIHLLETQLKRLDPVLRSIEARLTAGTTTRIADRLTVQSQIATMQLMIEEESRMAEDALAEARGRLGLSPAASLPAFAAPAVADINATDSAALQLSAARASEAAAMVKMARASAKPMTAVGLRLEREKTPMGDEDTIGVAFMSELPWRSRRYARSEIRAAEAEQVAAQTDGTAARYRISAALTRVDRAERLAATARRLSAETRARLDAEYDAMVRAAGVANSGESTVLQTVELLEKATNTELQIIRAETAVRAARAELWRYLPVARFSEP